MSRQSAWLLAWLFLGCLAACGCSPSAQVLQRVEQMENGDEDSRAAAIQGLGGMSSADRTAVLSQLARQLRDEEVEVRVKAARALAEISGQVRAAKTGHEPAPGGRSEENVAMADLEAGLVALAPELLEKLRDPGSQVRLFSATALAELPLEDKTAAVSELCDLFLNGSGKMRHAAGESLAGMGPEAREFVRRIRYLLSSAKVEPQTCHQIAVVLEKMGAEAKEEAVAELRKVLSDRDAAYQSEAAMTLGAIGPDARAAVPELTRCLQSDDPKLRTEAGRALRRIDPTGKR